MSTLLMRLAGPMQSWGTQSRYGFRETGLEPSKSGVVGLLCAALGKPRTNEETETEEYPVLSRLTNLRMGVRVDRAGVMLRDYHTIGGKHLREESENKKSSRYYGIRFVNSDTPSDKTVVSDRFYLADACFLVGLEARDAEGEKWLTILYERDGRSLRHPFWQLCLGRKAFVPSQPVRLKDGLSSRGLIEALQNCPPLCRARADAEPRIVVDAEAGEAEAEARMDVPLSFAERRFTVRYVKEVSRSDE